MFSFQGLKSMASRGSKRRRGRAVAGVEALEGRQLMTRGFWSGVPTAGADLGGQAGGAPAAQWRAWGPSASGAVQGPAGARQFGQRGALEGVPFGGGFEQGLSARPMSPMGGQRMTGGSAQSGGPFGRLGGGGFSSPADAPAPSPIIAAPDVTPVDSTQGIDARPTEIPFAPPFAHPDVQGEASSEQGWPGVDAEVFSDPAVQSAAEDLQVSLDELKELKRPSHASVGALMDDMEAIEAGDLTGDEADAKVKADEAAILASTGASQELIDAIQTKAAALRDAVNAAGGDSTTLPLLGATGARLGGPFALQGPSGPVGSFGPGGGPLGGFGGGPGGTSMGPGGFSGFRSGPGRTF